ncbi:MFS transporter [Flexivirga sp. ID2601S]|uniref:MFS transporter n=1 Tax=Flexivirga aerilata TaxID=1656889 RepID=A0A849AM59_9MICO|nr:MFS transporter [Flexivirga aerilata]
MTSETRRIPRLHPAWAIAAVTFLTMIGSAGFRAAPGVFMDPLHQEFGWSMGLMGSAVSLNLVLFGLTAPFSAALMERFGIRPVCLVALVLVAAGAILPVWMTSPWQLILCWGLLIGLGTGSMSMSLVATVTGRWFHAKRGLVSGVLTAANATGQLIFLPVLAAISHAAGWRWATAVVGLAAFAVVPLVLIFMRNRPEDIGAVAYGAPDGYVSPSTGGGARMALQTLRIASRNRAFWFLAGTFAICGATTNGLVSTHFIPAAMDHGMHETTAASLLALVGIFDIVGTIGSGWLTDRVDPRVLLVVYYGLRGVALSLLPSLFSSSMHPNMLAFVLFYGLDWVATVPPTMALAREHFGDRAPVVFGWIFACHQLGAAVAAWGAGWIRDDTGTYASAFYLAAVLCLVAAAVCLTIRRTSTPSSAQVPPAPVAVSEPT